MEKIHMKNLSYNELINILDSVSDGIVVTDAIGNYIYINSAYVLLTGIDKEYLIGKSVDDAYKNGVISNSVILEVIATKQRISLIQSYPLTGKKALITGSPVFDCNQSLIRIVAMMKDVTEVLSLQQRIDESEKESKKYLNELVHLRKTSRPKDIVYRSKKMDEVITLANTVAKFDSNTLITGESGVGKEKIARLIHSLSARAEKPFVPINCGAIPANLIESELFGYEGGAFTGAKKTGKMGLFEIADEGTIFLDEISDLPLEQQVKLLRVLQDKKISRVGSTILKKVDFRVIAATNKDLIKMVNEGRFRDDLFYRLNVVPIFVPPLRERPEDIPPLIVYFIDKFNKKYNVTSKMPFRIMSYFLNKSWDGNIRELENMIERYVIMSSEEGIDLASYFILSDDTYNLTDVTLKSSVEALEKKLITEAYHQFENTRITAEKLGVNQSTIVRKIRKYNIQKK